MQKHYYLMVDTETCGTLENGYVYDLGMAVVDRHGTVYESYSYVIYEVYVGMAELMKTAYYANKLPQYEEDLKTGRRKMVKFSTAHKKMWELLKKYNIVAVVAHNARFDTHQLNNTTSTIYKRKATFFPYNLPVWCTLTMAKQTICKQKTYINWCRENNYMTSNNQVRATAEILYRYITGDDNFVESHTGLEDVLIENKIFNKILRQHKAMRRTYYKPRAV
jgi:DNA polymerase III epsilon subunit-like protein